MKKLCVFVAALAVSATAQAVYQVRNITNQHAHPITHNVPIPSGESARRIYGDFSITVPGRGVASFTDIGDYKTGECLDLGWAKRVPTWGVIIAFRGNTMGFYYEGEGVMDVTVTTDGNLIVTPINGEVYTSGPCSYLSPTGGY